MSSREYRTEWKWRTILLCIQRLRNRHVLGGYYSQSLRLPCALSPIVSIRSYLASQMNKIQSLAVTWNKRSDHKEKKRNHPECKLWLHLVLTKQNWNSVLCNPGGFFYYIRSSIRILLIRHRLVNALRKDTFWIYSPIEPLILSLDMQIGFYSLFHSFSFIHLLL